MRQRPRNNQQKKLFTKLKENLEETEEIINHRFSTQMRLKMHDSDTNSRTYNRFTSLLDNLSFFISRCENEIYNLSPDLGGPQRGSLKEFLIGGLIQQFENRTGKIASCGWDDINNTHVGEVYNLIVAYKDACTSFRGRIFR